MRILLIDDDEHARAYLKRALERAGHDVELALNGRRVRERLDLVRPDVVLTDIFMPDVDGFETLAAVHAADPSLPIIVMSGGAPGLPDCLSMAGMLGACAILTKPVTLHALWEALHTATERGSGRSNTTHS